MHYTLWPAVRVAAAIDRELAAHVCVGFELCIAHLCGFRTNGDDFVHHMTGDMP